MPQTKHNLKTVKLRVSYFEQALLDWLTEVDGRTVSDHLRQALKYYVKRSPALDRKAFERWVTSEVASGIEDEDAREALLRDLRQFLSQDVQLPTSSVLQGSGIFPDPPTAVPPLFSDDE